jgi:hypothetical protein
MLAREKLPSMMSNKYTMVVLHCLTCLDPGNSMFDGETTKDEDGTVVGFRFVEEILLALSEISL